MTYVKQRHGRYLERQLILLRLTECALVGIIFFLVWLRRPDVTRLIIHVCCVIAFLFVHGAAETTKVRILTMPNRAAGRPVEEE